MTAKRVELDEALEANRLTYRKDASGVVSMRPRALHARPISERAMNMHARLERILQGLGKRSSITGAVANAEHPELAKEFVRVYWHFMMRHQPAPVFGIDWNPFRGLSEIDAGNKLNRLLENLCDRSTGRMGPWTNGISVTASAAR